MADNNVTAAGPTRGASYVLPWDTMAQYDQMVTATRDKFEAQNQQRLATIADMEKQDLTGMPSYDKALENHYEQLHAQVGKIITKYRDPFQSLEGMRELKDVQAKYIANPIVNNAKTTEDSYKRLQSDYATNLITPEDYNIKKGEYDKHITEGDVSKPFEYGRPDYLKSNVIFDDVFKDMDKAVLKDTPNAKWEGYTEDQFGQTVDLALIGQHKEALMREIDQNLSQNNIPVNEDNRRNEGIRLAKLYKPIDKRNIYHQATNDGGILGGYMKSDLILQTGLLEKELVGSLVPVSARTKAIEGISTLGNKENPAYSIDLNGADVWFNYANEGVNLNQSQFATATTLVPRQTIAESGLNRIRKAITKLKGDGYEFIGAPFSHTGKPAFVLDPNTGQYIKNEQGKNEKFPITPISKEEFEALANYLGFPGTGDTKDHDFIADEFNQGKYQLAGSFVTDDKDQLVEKGDPDNPALKYSVNALLFHYLNHGISAPVSPAEVPNYMADTPGFKEQNAGKDLVNVSNTQVPLRVSNLALMETNVKTNMPSGETGKVNLQMSMTGLDTYETPSNGYVIGKGPIGGWNGVSLQKKRKEIGNYGKDSFADLSRDPNALITVLNGYNSLRSNTVLTKDKGKTKLERLTDSGPIVLNKLYTSGGENSFENTSIKILNSVGGNFKDKTYDEDKVNLLSFENKTKLEMYFDFLTTQNKGGYKSIQQIQQEVVNQKAKEERLKSKK